MIVESSQKVRLGARVKVLQLIFLEEKLLKEEFAYGHVVRPATQDEYIAESKDLNRIYTDKYYYYEVRLSKK
jgi:hypothetical protein